MHTFSRYLAMCFAWVLGIVQTWVFLSTNEYWPLSFDDYIAVALMLWCARVARFQHGVVLLSAGWAFVAGNFYALRFSFENESGAMSVQMMAISTGLCIAVTGLLVSLIASKRFFGSGKHTV